MGYEGYSIEKYSSCWILSNPESEHIGSAKTKRECLRHLAKIFLEEEQSVLAEAYQETLREQGSDYSYMDALDALIHEASSNSRHFIEALRPSLWKRFNASRQVTFGVETV